MLYKSPGLAGAFFWSSLNLYPRFRDSILCIAARASINYSTRADSAYGPSAPNA